MTLIGNLAYWWNAVLKRFHKKVTNQKKLQIEKNAKREVCVFGDKKKQRKFLLGEKWVLVDCLQN